MTLHVVTRFWSNCQLRNGLIAEIQNRQNSLRYWKPWYPETFLPPHGTILLLVYGTLHPVDCQERTRYSGLVLNSHEMFKNSFISTVRLTVHTYLSQNGAFKNRCSNRRNLKTRALSFCVRGKRLENGVFFFLTMALR